MTGSICKFLHKQAVLLLFSARGRTLRYHPGLPVMKLSLVLVCFAQLSTMIVLQARSVPDQYNNAYISECPWGTSPSSGLVLTTSERLYCGLRPWHCWNKQTLQWPSFRITSLKTLLMLTYRIRRHLCVVLPLHLYLYSMQRHQPLRARYALVLACSGRSN